MTWIGILAVFAAGAIVGSFLNVVIYRLPRQQDIVFARSVCPACGYQIPFYLNVPIFSFIVLRGRCADCRQPIARRYPLIELMSAALAVLVVWRFGYAPAAVFYLVLVFHLIAMAAVDFEWQIIPNKLLISCLLFGVLINLWVTEIHWPDAGIGFIVGGALMYSIAAIGNWYFKKESVGMGDVKLAAVLGFFLGWKLVLVMLYSGYLLAALYYLVLRITRRGVAVTQLPMAPFFAAGTLILAGWWRPLLNFYLMLVT